MTLVTGGATGLGLATVSRFAEKGARIIICDLPQSKGAKVAEEIGENAIFVGADVRLESDVKNVLDETQKKFGKLDLVVNCAALQYLGETYDFGADTPSSLKDFQAVFDVSYIYLIGMEIPSGPDLFRVRDRHKRIIFREIFQTKVLGTLNVNRLAVGLMKQNKPDENGLRGLIINTSGAESIATSLGQVPMVAGAGAIAAITLPLAKDLAEVGIRVVTISPGFMETSTDMLKQSLGMEETLTEDLLRAPNRFGAPDEFAHLTQMIVMNPHINGTTIELTGGIH